MKSQRSKPAARSWSTDRPLVWTSSPSRSTTASSPSRAAGHPRRGEGNPRRVGPAPRGDRHGHATAPPVLGQIGAANGLTRVATRSWPDPPGRPARSSRRFDLGVDDILTVALLAGGAAGRSDRDHRRARGPTARSPSSGSARSRSTSSTASSGRGLGRPPLGHRAEPALPAREPERAVVVAREILDASGAPTSWREQHRGPTSGAAHQSSRTTTATRASSATVPGRATASSRRSPTPAGTRAGAGERSRTN